VIFCAFLWQSLPAFHVSQFLWIFAPFCGKSSFMDHQAINQLCDIVRETSYAIHKYHRHGHLEKIYENALAHRLRFRGMQVEQQYPLKVYDEDGFVLGDYYADLFVEKKLIVELKAVREVIDEHVAQILGYLRSARVETGLLINFGAPRLHVKKYLMTDDIPRRDF
jgi:GxxExxY protein